MLTRDIYHSALRLLGESVNEEENLDYEERTPYILGSFCSSLKSTDKLIRNAEGLSPQGKFCPITIALDAEFPFCDELVTTASLYLAAMLVIDSDEALYEKLFERYCDSLMCIKLSIKAKLEKITECY